MSTARDRRESTPVDFSPEEQACPACQVTLKERDPKPRWVIRLDQDVTVVSPVLACGTTACTRPAVVYRPPPAEALAWRGDALGRDVVARIGEWRDRHTWSIPKIRAPRQTESPRSIALQEVAWWCEVLWALVTMVAHHEEARMGPVSTWDGLVLASEGVQPDTSHAPLEMWRDGCSGRVCGAKTLLSSATGAMESWIDAGRSGGRPMVGGLSETPASSC